ncbi:M23 family metallopeptidase [Candidatus Peribacteria bacterium]|nr:MAG: M23 family metallopeptidase [Candidatus Peribacteria bacterium]
MPQIDIQIDRPYMTLALVGVIVAGTIYGNSGTQAESPMGGDMDAEQMSNPVVIATTAEADMAKVRDEQLVLSKREEILREQLAALDDAMANGAFVDIDVYIETRDELVNLLKDKVAAEQKLVEALHEFWAADGYAFDASRYQSDDGSAVRFLWPVEPELGISARFEDSGYEKRFGMPHHALDIPTAQGTVITAAADGIVTKVSDQGMGFSSIVISHKNGMATMYGHVSGFLVAEGDTVEAGDPIALSGGTPGTKGAGLLTTGAHLHVAFYKDGAAVDPLDWLPTDGVDL